MDKGTIALIILIVVGVVNDILTNTTPFFGVLR